MSKKKSFFWPILDGNEAKEKETIAQTASTSSADSANAGQVAPVAQPQNSGLPPMPSEQPALSTIDGSAEMPTSSVLANLKSRAQEQAGKLSAQVSQRGEAAVPAEPQKPIVAPSGNADGLLVLENVQRSYLQADNELKVLVDANLSVKAGEMVALVAPSGAGKSTLLHIAGLLERPDQGEVYIAGEAQSDAADRARTMTRRSEIGFVYQFHHLLAEFSAVENVMLPQLIRGESKSEAKERSLELLKYLKVDHRATHRPAELSGGEQQRVAIARAMANAPRVLLADEPTGNLDPTTSDYVFKALNALVKQSGISALVATHNLFLAERMDRQITLVDGKIVEL